jgi:hypothetical protein
MRRSSQSATSFACLDSGPSLPNPMLVALGDVCEPMQASSRQSSISRDRDCVAGVRAYVRDADLDRGIPSGQPRVEVDHPVVDSRAATDKRGSVGFVAGDRPECIGDPGGPVPQQHPRSRRVAYQPSPRRWTERSSCVRDLPSSHVLATRRPALQPRADRRREPSGTGLAGRQPIRL